MVKQMIPLDAIFGALADPTRRQILELLRRGEQKVTDLAAPFQISLAAISKHLKVLERAGLIKRTKQGRVHHMRANPSALSEAQSWIEAYARGWDESFDALERFLSARHGKDGDSNEERSERE